VRGLTPSRPASTASAFNAKRKSWYAPCEQIKHDGQITKKSVQSLRAKNIPLAPSGKIKMHNSRHPCPTKRGRRPSSQTRGQGAVGRDGAKDERIRCVRRNRFGSDAPMQAFKFKGSQRCPESDGVTKSRVTRTISYKPLKPLRREGPEAFRPNLYAHVQPILVQHAHETAGAARAPRSSLRPLISGGAKLEQTSGKIVPPRNAKTASSRHCERSEAIHVAT